MTGLILCAVPLAKECYTKIIQRRTVATYEEFLKERTRQSSNSFQEAKQYNRRLFLGKEEKEYETMLDLCGNGVMGTIEIPKIRLCLPIYHGTDEEVLSSGAGHLKGSSLPTGGENTRCVLTGHRGLPGAKLFTRLDELKKGDLFFLRICNHMMAYQVRKIEVIEPDEGERLRIIPKKDMVSLLTCTPYGINTHRLVITGERVPYKKSERKKIRPKILSVREIVFTALPFLFLGLSILDDIKERRF